MLCYILSYSVCINVPFIVFCIVFRVTFWEIKVVERRSGKLASSFSVFMQEGFFFMLEEVLNFWKVNADFRKFNQGLT